MRAPERERGAAAVASAIRVEADLHLLLRWWPAG